MYNYKKIVNVTLFSSLLFVANTPALSLTIFSAEKIITMEDDQPVATAVAIENGRIAALGSLDSLLPLIEKSGGDVNRSLEGMVLLPGFIDAHVHPTLPAILTQFPFAAPESWSLPTGEFPGSTSPEDYIARLKELIMAHDKSDEPFITWGYHPLWHGDIDRQSLSSLFPDTPVIIWHRSFHELFLNDLAISWLGISGDSIQGLGELANLERGHFKENGLMAIMPRLQFLIEPKRFQQGMEIFLDMLHRGGVTTALDMGIGIFGTPQMEINLIRGTAENMQSPSRIILTPIITDFLARKKSPEEALKEIESWRAGNSSRVIIDKHFKLMIDGAIFSGLSQMGPPGYLDGHEGVWMVPIPLTRQWAEVFWNAGYKLHAHTNGDKSADALLELVKELDSKFPRENHGTTLEHFAYTREEQNQLISELGMMVSANPYYNYILSDIYSEKWLGTERGSKMVRLGSLERLNVPFALHSDCPMAPLSPLTLAWTATTRQTINGKTSDVNEKISRRAAIRAITIDAARVMGWENEIGSIRVGKKADFVILDQDPFETEASDLKKILVKGTIFEGKHYPISGEVN